MSWTGWWHDVHVSRRACFKVPTVPNWKVLCRRCVVGEPLWFWSCRFTVALLCCLSVMSMYAQQCAISNPVTCTVNNSLILLQNYTSACDANNTVSEKRPFFACWTIFWQTDSVSRSVVWSSSGLCNLRTGRPRGLQNLKNYVHNIYSDYVT